MEAALAADKIGSMMAMVNAHWPPLHVTVIDTDLALPELVRHLRQFIYVETETGEELTLRFADGAVLPALALHLSAAQWSALAAPLKTWRVHSRDAGMNKLPSPTLGKDTPAMPFVLTDGQVAALKDAMGADRLLANLRNMWPSQEFGRSPMEAFSWASDARAMWLAAGRADDALLLKFALGVFETKGRILRLSNLAAIVAQPNLEQVWEDLRKFVELNNYESQNE
ncbi:DUF4123 domain-containing protein [Pseudoduganella aquatica]|uniref:DUF4123 domain-containing protein n=1 Tax=Pseudoduganella aquatica TaxID=2660641 RepID=A0A7X4HHX6_9BURK|nr:DUF4123 domain-containing protein [Pseudoduganella aquatica]